MGFFGDLWSGVKSVGSSVIGSIESVGETVAHGVGNVLQGKNPFSAENQKPSEYKSWDDVPWYERAALNIGSGVESAGKKIAGFVGLDDYAPSMFTDTKNQIKSDISQKGSSEGWNWETFGKGTGGYKIYDALVNDHPNLSESTGSSLEMGAGVSGGGENQMKVYGGGVNTQAAPPTSGTSLGKALAIEPEIALQDENFNYNNFNF